MQWITVEGLAYRAAFQTDPGWLPWRDTMSSERPGWRERAANLDGQTVFAIDYQICRRCQLGWVELTYIDPSCQRCGLASAGLAALRAEHPELS